MVNGALDQVVKAARENFPMRATDVRGPDGVLRCAVCGGVREFSFNGRVVPCACRCDSERDAARRAELERREARGAVIHSALYDSAFSNFTFERDNRPNSELSRRAQEYSERPDRGLLMVGVPRTGKTFAAAMIINAVRVRGVQAQIVSMTRLLYELDGFSSNRNELFSQIERCPLLALDDVGSERGSEYQQEKAFAVIDARTRGGRPTIITGDEVVDTNVENIYVVEADYTEPTLWGNTELKAYGGYYTWNAATAGTGASTTYSSRDASSSICPKGWRLPTGDSDGDFKVLNDALGGVTDNDAHLINPDGPAFLRAGIAWDGSAGTTGGSGGHYWSSKSDFIVSGALSSGALSMQFSSNGSGVYPVIGGTRYAGYSVRCIAR